MFPFCLHGDHTPEPMLPVTDGDRAPAPQKPQKPEPTPKLDSQDSQDSQDAHDEREAAKRAAFEKQRALDHKLREHGSEFSHMWAFHTFTF